MLSEASWLPKALALSLQDGRSRRVDHDCGEGRSLLLSRDGPTLKAWCFRCNDKGFHKLEEPLADRLARLSAAGAADNAAASQVDPPEGLRNPAEWPVGARLWLAKAGLHSGDIGALQARYDPETRRVVLPVPGFWQARAIFPGQVPKYLAPNVDKSKVLPRWGNAERITLTEDILSAYKVGKVAEGWCLMGTVLNQHTLLQILQSGKGVNVWLDNDLPPLHSTNRGQIAAAKVVKTLRSHGVDVRNIVTTLDPKLTPYGTIKELLCPSLALACSPPLSPVKKPRP